MWFIFQNSRKCPNCNSENLDKNYDIGVCTCNDCHLKFAMFDFAEKDDNSNVKE